VKEEIVSICFGEIKESKNNLLLQRLEEEKEEEDILNTATDIMQNLILENIVEVAEQSLAESVQEYRLLRWMVIDANLRQRFSCLKRDLETNCCPDASRAGEDIRYVQESRGRSSQIFQQLRPCSARQSRIPGWPDSQVQGCILYIFQDIFDSLIERLQWNFQTLFFDKR